MEIACLILDYLRVLTWPGVVVFVLWKFSKPISSLISRTNKIEVLGISAGFFDKAAAATYSQMPKKEIIEGDDQTLAEQGDSKAQYNLGARYMKGEGVPQDNAKAVVWYRKAADQGHALAQFMLGIVYARGKGVPQDNAKAVVWYRKAADQGHALAQFMLGIVYARGKGVPQDNAKAVVWYRKAADQGHALAQFMLGMGYADGKGVPQDDETAYIWFNLAASRSTGEDRERAVKVRDRFAALLTREQLAEAQHGAREWYNTHPQ